MKVVKQPEDRFFDGNNCLHEACTGGHLQTVKYLIEARGADIEARDKFGKTPLHGAASEERMKVLKYLILRGADVQGQDDTIGFTTLGEAAIQGRLGVAKLLLKNGADVGHKGARDLTPLHAASFAAQPKLVELLLRFGAESEVKLHNSGTPLSIAGTSPMGNTKKGAKEEVVKLLNDAIEAKRSGETKLIITGLVVALLTVVGLKVFYKYRIAERHNGPRKIIQERRHANEERQAIENDKKRGERRHDARKADADQGGNVERATAGRNHSNKKHGKLQKERNAQQPIAKRRMAHVAGAANDNEDNFQHEARHEKVPRSGYEGAGQEVDKEEEEMVRELQQLKKEREAREQERVAGEENKSDLLQQQQLWEHEREAMRDEVLCSVCLDGLKDTALSCGHQACGRCAKPLEICHICRQKITVRTRLY